MRLGASLRAVASVAAVAALSVVGGLAAWSVLPMAAGWQPTVVLSGSMSPRILPGDVVLSAPVTPGDVQVGRVLLVEDPSATDRLLLHRAVEVAPDGTVTTRGDANPSPDLSPVPPESVRGLPRLRIPAVGLPVLWVRDGQWPLLAITLLGAAVAVHLAFPPARPVRNGRRRERSPAGHRAPTRRLLGGLAAVGLVGLAGAVPPHAVAAYSATTVNSADSWATLATYPNYAQTVATDGAVVHLPLDETTGDWPYTASDISGQNRHAKYGAAPTTPATVSGPGGSRQAVPFLPGGYATTNSPVAYGAGSALTATVWFRAGAGGGNLMTLSDTRYGRGSADAGPRLYLNQTGALCLSVADDTVTRLCLAQGASDGNWHQAAIVVEPGVGLRLHLDGGTVQNGKSLSSTDVLSMAAVTGWWKLGTDSRQPSVTMDFNGALAEAAVYNRALTQTELSAQFAYMEPAAYDTLVNAHGAAHRWRLAEAATSGTPMPDIVGSASGAYHSFSAGAVTLKAPGGVVGGTAVTLNGTVGIDSTTLPAAPATFSMELWFRTATTQGGVLVAYTSSPTGLDGASDRILFLTDDGHLVLGVGPGGISNTATSPATYNDDQWHMVTGTLGPTGLRLYVDGVLVATNISVTTTAITTGYYWRWGGGPLAGWPTPPTSAFLNGALDNASIYHTALTAQQVAWHRGSNR